METNQKEIYSKLDNIVEQRFREDGSDALAFVFIRQL